MTSSHEARNAIVIGSGPNGLAAAITLAKAGRRVTVYEKNTLIGGACRSSALIKPGYIHDTGSAIHPLAVSSPFFREVPLRAHGLNWIFPPTALAHPLDDGSAVLLKKSILDTVDTLDKIDKNDYVKLMEPLAHGWDRLVDDLMFFPRLLPPNTSMIFPFGTKALYSAGSLAKHFRGSRARALFAGLGVHSVMRMDRITSAAAGLTLGIAAHVTGWPLPAGGAQKLTDAMVSYLSTLGGKIVIGNEVTSISELPAYRELLLDITPRQFLRIADRQLPRSYKEKLTKFRYGPGVFKMDWILSSPIPWKNPDCLTAGTVHLGGGMEEIIAAENEVWQGQHPEKPFVLLTQPSLFDRTRINGKDEVAWAYCHVPNGSKFDMSGRIENQIERFAPGFKERIIGRKVSFPSDIETDNANCIGGDITGGLLSVKRLLYPDISYKTPLQNVYLCSSTMAPGPGVHGMCGYRAAQIALEKYHD